MLEAPVRAGLKVSLAKFWPRLAKAFSTSHISQWSQTPAKENRSRSGSTRSSTSDLDNLESTAAAMPSNPRPNRLWDPHTVSRIKASRFQLRDGTRRDNPVSSSSVPTPTSPKFDGQPPPPHSRDHRKNASASAFQRKVALGLQELARKGPHTEYNRKHFLQIEEQTRLIGFLHELSYHQRKVHDMMAEFKEIYESMGDLTGLRAIERQALHAEYNQAVSAAREMDTYFDIGLEQLKDLLNESVPPENWETLMFGIRAGVEAASREKDAEGEGRVSK